MTKVTYNSGEFFIEGCKILDTKLLPFYIEAGYYILYSEDVEREMKDGDKFDLPENIVWDKVDVPIITGSIDGPTIDEITRYISVIHLKLKSEPKELSLSEYKDKLKKEITRIITEREALGLLLQPQEIRDKLIDSL